MEKILIAEEAKALEDLSKGKPEEFESKAAYHLAVRELKDNLTVSMKGGTIQ